MCLTFSAFWLGHLQYPITLQDSSYKLAFTSRVENSVDPDQLASRTTLFSEQDISEFSMERVSNI